MPDLEVENLIDVDDKPKKLKSGEICVTFSIYLGIIFVIFYICKQFLKFEKVSELIQESEFSQVIQYNYDKPTLSQETLKIFSETFNRIEKQRTKFGIPDNLEDLMDECHLKYVVSDIENIDQKIKAAQDYDIDNDWIRFSMRTLPPKRGSSDNRYEFSLLYNPNYNKAKLKMITDKPEIINTIKKYLSLRERLESKRHCLEQILSDEQIQNIGPDLIEMKPQKANNTSQFRYAFPTPVFAISFDHVHELAMNFPRFMKMIENLSLLKKPTEILVYELPKNNQQYRKGALQEYFDVRWNYNKTRRTPFEKRIPIKVIELPLREYGDFLADNLKVYGFKEIVHTQGLLHFERPMAWLDASVAPNNVYMTSKAARQKMELRIINLYQKIESEQLKRRSVGDRSQPYPISCEYFIIPATFHNTMDSTCNQMLNYFKTTDVFPATYALSQLQSGGIFKFISSPQCIDALHLPGFFCAINQKCMAPEGHILKCHPGGKRFREDPEIREFHSKKQRDSEITEWKTFLEARRKKIYKNSKGLGPIFTNFPNDNHSFFGIDSQELDSNFKKKFHYLDFDMKNGKLNKTIFNPDRCNTVCHRYDQSLENLVTGNYHHWDQVQYYAWETGPTFFSVGKREGDTNGLQQGLDSTLGSLFRGVRDLSRYMGF